MARAPAECPKSSAIFRSSRVKPVYQPQTTGAFHVFDNDGWISWNMLSEMPSNQPGIKIVAGADAIADIKIDCLALIEIRHVLRVPNAEQTETNQSCQRQFGLRSALCTCRAFTCAHRSTSVGRSVN